jgi:D-serine dehydratase
MELTSLLTTPLDATIKGLPDTGNRQLRLGDIPTMGWNVLRGDLPIPVATISESRLRANSRWMSAFTRRYNVRLCPHGKTTMAPQLFQLQLDDGAWGITVATVQQMRVCRRFGVDRILMANQLVGRHEVGIVYDEINRHEDFDFYCLVDSVENLRDLCQAANELGLRRPLQVLVELGAYGGRTGCRTLREATDLARIVADCKPIIALAGVEAFEGAIAVADACAASTIVEFVGNVAEFFARALEEGLFDVPRPILTIGGSIYFDLVATHPAVQKLRNRCEVVLRSGCYLTHDSKMLASSFASMRERTPELAAELGSLSPALSIWGRVQSVPEEGLAIVNVGKRDVSHDIDLPVVESWCRPGRHERIRPVRGGIEVVQLNDQHAFLRQDPGKDLRVGDLVELGISHPCTTFDKWRLLYVVNDAMDVTDGILTFF